MVSRNRFNDHGYWCRTASITGAEKNNTEFFPKHPLLNNRECVHSLIFSKRWIWIWSLSFEWGGNTHFNTGVGKNRENQKETHKDTRSFPQLKLRIKPGIMGLWGSNSSHCTILPYLIISSSSIFLANKETTVLPTWLLLAHKTEVCEFTGPKVT